MHYRGRFAPSPTGPLHAGSLLTAVASYVDAKANGGCWLLRIEDLDPPRIQPGAETAILKALEAYGLYWDEPLVRQSERLDIYQAYLDQLITKGSAYPCCCSRSQLQSRDALLNYDGHCRKDQPRSGAQIGIRVLGGISESYTDQIQGHQPEEIVSDFIIKRRDGLFAYQLAVVVDDHLQQINHIVRGKDLLSETPKQRLLQRSLNFSQLKNYAHLPLILAKNGQKLSKQTRAEAIATDADSIRKNLIRILELLQLDTPKDMIYNDFKDILEWTIVHWDMAKLPKDLSMELNDHKTLV